MALRRKTKRPEPAARIKTEAQAQEKKSPKKGSVVFSISQVFRNLSISINLTVYAVYLIYLLYSIKSGVGIKAINIALALVTAAFMVVYLILRLSSKKSGKQLKEIKYYYKSFKLVARTISAITAVYALLTAFTSVSPLAIIIAFLGAVFMILRLIVEFVLYLIRRRIRKLKRNIRGKALSEDEINEESQPTGKRKRKRKLWEIAKKDDELEDVFVPVDQCLLNDIDEDSTIFDDISLHIN